MPRKLVCPAWPERLRGDPLGARCWQATSGALFHPGCGDGPAATGAVWPRVVPQCDLNQAMVGPAMGCAQWPAPFQVRNFVSNPLAR